MLIVHMLFYYEGTGFIFIYFKPGRDAAIKDSNGLDNFAGYADY